MGMTVRGLGVWMQCGSEKTNNQRIVRKKTGWSLGRFQNVGIQLWKVLYKRKEVCTLTTLTQNQWTSQFQPWVNINFSPSMFNLGALLADWPFHGDGGDLPKLSWASYPILEASNHETRKLWQINVGECPQNMYLVEPLGCRIDSKCPSNI